MKKETYFIILVLFFFSNGFSFTRVVGSSSIEKSHLLPGQYYIYYSNTIPNDIITLIERCINEVNPKIYISSGSSVELLGLKPEPNNDTINTGLAKPLNIPDIYFGNGRINIYWGSLLTPALGHTAPFSSTSNSNSHTEFNIVIDKNRYINEDRDLASIIKHEILHGVGLGHTTEDFDGNAAHYKIMYEIAPATGDEKFMSQDEVNGLNDIYNKHYLTYPALPATTSKTINLLVGDTLNFSYKRNISISDVIVPNTTRELKPYDILIYKGSEVDKFLEMSNSTLDFNRKLEDGIFSTDLGKNQWYSIIQGDESMLLSPDLIRDIEVFEPFVISPKEDEEIDIVKAKSITFKLGCKDDKEKEYDLTKLSDLSLKEIVYNLRDEDGDLIVDKTVTNSISSDLTFNWTPDLSSIKAGDYKLEVKLLDTGHISNNQFKVFEKTVDFTINPSVLLKKKTKQNKSGIYFSGDDNHYFETIVTEFDGITDFTVDHVKYYYKKAEIEGSSGYQQIYNPPVEKFHNGQNTVYSLDWNSTIQTEGYYIIKAKAYYKSDTNPDKFYSSSDSLLLEIVNNRTVIVTPGNNEIHNINTERSVGYSFTNAETLGTPSVDYQPALSITDQNGVEYKDSLSFYSKSEGAKSNKLLGGYFKPGYLKPGKYRIWAAAYNNELNRFKAAPDSLNFYVPEWGLTLEDLNPHIDFYYPETKFAYQKPLMLKLNTVDNFDKDINVSITNSITGSEVFTTTLSKAGNYQNSDWIPDYHNYGFYKITMTEEASEIANGQNLIQSQEIQICPLYETFESYESNLSTFFSEWEQTGSEPEIWKKIVSIDNSYGFNKENSLLCSYFKTKDHIELNSFAKEFTIDPQYNFAVSFRYALEKRNGSYPPIYADYRVKASFDNGNSWSTIFEVLATEQGKKHSKNGNIASLNKYKTNGVLGVRNEKTAETVRLQKGKTKEDIYFDLYESSIFFSKGNSNIKLMFETKGDPAWYSIDHPDSTWWDQHFVYDDVKIHYEKNMMEGNFLEDQIVVGSDENYTFSAGQHHIMNNIEVGTGKGEAVLTIEPGAELIFHGAHEIRIGANGKLNMKGTIDKPIKFTVDTANFVESDQYWRKIIVVLDKTADASIEYCNFDFKNKYFFRSIIESYETNVAIKNCQFTGLKSSGVVSFYGAEYNSNEPELVNLPELSKLVFVNNLISENNSSHIVYAVSSTDLNIANNTITDCNNSTLFKTKYRSTKAKIYNNIFSENYNSNLIELSDNYHDGKHLNKKFFYNNFFKTSRSYLANDNDSITFENNVSEICFFKDNSFELSSKSNLINLGYSDEYTNSYLPNVDLNGNQRIVADKVDLGAFEFQNTAEPRYLSGYLSGTLLKSESPYLISGDLYIRNGEFLKIEPGVKLVFLGHNSLNVDGEIEAIGTNEEPITFTAADTTGHFDTTTPQGGWNGIIINDNHNEKVLFEHAIIEYVKKYVIDKNNEFSLGAITITNSYPKVKYCEIRYNNVIDGGGIYLSSFTKYSEVDHWNHVFEPENPGEIIGNKIHDNKAVSGGGISLYWSKYAFKGSNFIVKNNVIYNNKAKNGGGISYCSNVVIDHNTIVNNTSEQKGSGIFIKWSNCTVRNSIIWGNTSLGESGKKGQIYGELYRSFRNLIVTTFNNCLEGGSDIFEFNTSNFSELDYKVFTSGNIDENPLFNNSPENDFVISTSSPCINKGATYSYRDLDGSLPDIGALAINGEFSGSSLVLPERVITGLAPANLSGEYKVLGTLYVPENQILQITPGSKIIFADNAELNVKGKIICTGTEDEPIEFRGVDNQLVWRGINIYDTNLKSVFKHSIIRDSNQGGIKLINTKAAIDNCTFTQNSAWTGGGICSFNSDVEITNSKFVNNITLLSENSLYLGLIHDYFHEMYEDAMNPYKYEEAIRPWGEAMSLFHSEVKVNKCYFSNNGGMGINIANDIFFPIYTINPKNSDSVKNKRESKNKNIKNTDIDKRVYFTNNLLMGNTNTSMVISEANPVVVNNTFLGDNYPIEQTEYYNSLIFSNAAVIQNNIFTGYLYAMYPYGGMVFNNNIMIDDFDLGGSNNIIADPLLLDSEEKPYLTSASSPAINAGSLEGVREYLGQLDIDGNQRVDDGAVDIGCFEHLKDLTAKFSVSSRIIQPGDSLTYVDESYGAPAKWYWDFDNDGVIDSGKKRPKYAYSEKGLKSVNLIVEREAFKDTLLSSDYILVTDLPEVVKPISDLIMTENNIPLEIDSVFSRPNSETFTYSVTNEDSLLLHAQIESNKLNITKLQSKTATDTVVLRADFQIIFDKKSGKVINGDLLRKSKEIKLKSIDHKSEKYTFNGFVTDTFFVEVKPSGNILELKDIDPLIFAEDDSLTILLDSLVVDENPETVKWDIEILGLDKTKLSKRKNKSLSLHRANRSLKFADDNLKLKNNEDVWFVLDSLKRKLTFKAKENYFIDSLEVRFTATDLEGSADSTTAKLSITPINDAPVLLAQIPDQKLSEGIDSLVVDLTNHFSDVDNEILIYTVTPENTIAQFKVVDSNLIIYRLGESIGDTKVVVVANDQVSKEIRQNVSIANDQQQSKIKATVSTSFNLSVKPFSNNPVVETAIPDTIVAEDFGSIVYNLNNYFADPNSDELTYTISADSNKVKMSVVDSLLSINSLTNIYGKAEVVISADDQDQNNGSKIRIKHLEQKSLSFLGMQESLKEERITKSTKAVVADTFFVDITPVNDSPELIANIPDSYIGEGMNSIQICLGEHFKDVDFDELHFKTNHNSAEVECSVADSILTISRNSDWLGTTEIKVLCSDSLLFKTDTKLLNYSSDNVSDKASPEKQYIVSDIFKITIDSYQSGAYVAYKIPDIWVWQNFFGSIWINLNCFFKSSNNLPLSYCVENNHWEIKARLFWNYLRLKSRFWWTGVTEVIVYAWERDSDNKTSSVATPDRIPAKLKINKVEGGKSSLTEKIFTPKSDLESLGMDDKYSLVSDTFNVHVIPWWWCGHKVEVLDTIEVNLGDSLKMSDLLAKINIKNDNEDYSHLLYYGKEDADSSYYNQIDSTYNSNSDSTLIEEDESLYTSIFDVEFNEPGVYKFAEIETSESESNSKSRKDIIELMKEKIIYVKVNAPTSIKEIVPEKTALRGNYPNPFNPTTSLQFNLATEDKVSIFIYNSKGELVSKLLDKQFRKAGFHKVNWNGTDMSGKSVSSGTYLYLMKTEKGNYTKIKKMIMLK